MCRPRATDASPELGTNARATSLAPTGQFVSCNCERMEIEQRNRHRRSVRLPGFDYAAVGAFFVTLIAFDRQNLFGGIDDSAFQPNLLGVMATEEWLAIRLHRVGIELGPFVVMPNHLHGIVLRTEPAGLAATQPNEQTRSGQPHGLGSGTLGAIVGAYKAAVTRRHRRTSADSKAIVWQRSFYEHVIRDDNDWNAIANYIEDNPTRWFEDSENPARIMATKT